MALPYYLTESRARGREGRELDGPCKPRTMLFQSQYWLCTGADGTIRAYKKEGLGLARFERPMIQSSASLVGLLGRIPVSTSIVGIVYLSEAESDLDLLHGAFCPLAAEVHRERASERERERDREKNNTEKGVRKPPVSGSFAGYVLAIHKKECKRAEPKIQAFLRSEPFPPEASTPQLQAPGPSRRVTGLSRPTRRCRRTPCPVMGSVCLEG